MGGKIGKSREEGKGKREEGRGRSEEGGGKRKRKERERLDKKRGRDCREHGRKHIGLVNGAKALRLHTVVLIAFYEFRSSLK